MARDCNRPGKGSPQTGQDQSRGKFGQNLVFLDASSELKSSVNYPAAKLGNAQLAGFSLSCWCTLLQGAEEMGHMEHLLNVYASRSAKDSIATFVGYSQVKSDQATRSLTEGLWLVRLASQNRRTCHLLLTPRLEHTRHYHDS